MDALGDFADPSVFDTMASSQQSLEAATNNLFRLMDGHNALVMLYESSSTMTTESFEAASMSTLSMFFAGTDIQMDVENLSQESLGKTIIAVGKAIGKAILEFFKRLTDFLKDMDVATTYTMTMLNHIEKRIAASRGKTVSEDMVTLGREYRFLRFGPLFADDSIKLERELETLLEILKVVSGDYINDVMALAGRIPTAAEGKTGKALDDALVAEVAKTPFKSVVSSLNMKDASQDRFNRSNVKTTGPIIGGKSIYFFDRDLNEKGVKGLRFYGFFHEDTGREVVAVDKEKKFPTLNPVQIVKIPGLVKKVVMMLSKQGTNGLNARLDRTKSALTRYSDGLYQTELTSDDLDTIRKTVMQVVYWLKTPLDGTYSNAMSVSRAVLSYCAKSISTYR